MRKKYIETISVIIFVASIAFMNAQAQPNNVSKDCEMLSNPNIVLVHGAWADGSSWSKVIPLLQEKGYNPTNQIVGYLLSGDPAYIPRHKDARNLIRKLERDEIMEELMKSYLKDHKL